MIMMMTDRHHCQWHIIVKVNVKVNVKVFIKSIKQTCTHSIQTSLTVQSLINHASNTWRQRHAC